MLESRLDRGFRKPQKHSHYSWGRPYKYKILVNYIQYIFENSRRILPNLALVFKGLFTAIPLCWDEMCVRRDDFDVLK
jgi:hypothetical protein